MEQSPFFKRGNTKARSIIARSIIIIAVTGVALIIPNFTDFLNIVGALGAGLIAFIFPPLMYNLEFGPTMSDKQYYFNWSLIAFGVIGATMSISTSIDSIMTGQN